MFKILLIVSLLIVFGHGFDPPDPSYGFSKCNYSWDRMDCDCDDGKVPCNVPRYPEEAGYFGCISARNKSRCCPRGFIYSSTPFYSEKYPAFTCVKKNEIFNGSISEKASGVVISKGCLKPDEVSCRSEVRKKGIYNYYYIHKCQHIKHMCNTYCYQGYKWCENNQICLALSSYKSFCGKQKRPDDPIAYNQSTSKTSKTGQEITEESIWNENTTSKLTGCTRNQLICDDKCMDKKTLRDTFDFMVCEDGLPVLGDNIFNTSSSVTCSKRRSLYEKCPKKPVNIKLFLGLGLGGGGLFFLCCIIAHATITCRKYRLRNPPDINETMGTVKGPSLCMWIIRHIPKYYSGDMMYEMAEQDAEVRDTNEDYGYGDLGEENEIVDENEYYGESDGEGHAEIINVNTVYGRV